MRFIVGEKEFDSYSDAKKYEAELEKIEQEKKEEIRKEEFKEFLEEYLHTFEAVKKSGDKLYFAIITDDEPSKYAYALAERYLGRKFSFNHDTVVSNWVLDESESIKASTLDLLVRGIQPSKTVVFQSKKFESSIIGDTDTSTSEGKCKFKKPELEQLTFMDLLSLIAGF